ncbi:MAG: alanine/glycine:cation symporter family protein [Gammaproteobacteria bacterium]
MATIESWLHTLSGALWSEYCLVPLLAGVGVYLTFALRAFTWRNLLRAFTLLWRGRRHNPHESGEISPFQALMTALAATVGTGNIAGVATAIGLGGPGAVFWMWVIALFGMATKYSEAVLAVRYREVDDLGNYVGGPMYYIRNGLGRGWGWLAAAFALFGMVAAFGIGNMVQANSVADVLGTHFGVPTVATGLVAAALTAVVVIGGVRRIATVAGAVVPSMALLYVGIALVIILLNVEAVPAALGLIIERAFEPAAAGGAGLWVAMRWGFARGCFSNEAGLGSAAIAHAAARTHNAVEQGMIAMLGTFIDTIVICTMTALVIIVTGAWLGADEGAALSASAFALGIGDLGAPIVGIALALFAFTTVIGWSYYGERCAEYLFGTRVIDGYRVTWVIAVFLGAVFELDVVWALADITNGLMALPNLFALILLSPVVVKMTRESRAHGAPRHAQPRD